MHTSEFEYTARAMETLCFCPPLMLTPRSPISVRSPPYSTFHIKKKSKTALRKTGRGRNFTLTGSNSRSCCSEVTSIAVSYLAGSKTDPNSMLSRTYKTKYALHFNKRHIKQVKLLACILLPTCSMITFSFMIMVPRIRNFKMIKMQVPFIKGNKIGNKKEARFPYRCIKYP